jgi:hypothetical protein
VAAKNLKDGQLVDKNTAIIWPILHPPWDMIGVSSGPCVAICFMVHMGCTISLNGDLGISDVVAVPLRGKLNVDCVLAHS